MNLNVLDRLMILHILPKESNIVTLRAVRDITKMVGFTPEELEFLQFKTDDKGIRWSEEYKDYSIDVIFPDAYVGIIKEQLTKLSEQNKLREEYLSIYDKFVV